MVPSDQRLRHQYVLTGTHTHRWIPEGIHVQSFPSPTKLVEAR
jgi:hypothetical protein